MYPVGKVGSCCGDTSRVIVTQTEFISMSAVVACVDTYMAVT